MQKDAILHNTTIYWFVKIGFPTLFMHTFLQRLETCESAMIKNAKCQNAKSPDKVNSWYAFSTGVYRNYTNKKHPIMKNKCPISWQEDKLTRKQDSMRHRSIAQPLVPFLTRYLVSFLSVPLWTECDIRTIFFLFHYQ